MTPHDLAAWAERAKPEEQRAVLEKVFALLKPEPPKGNSLAPTRQWRVWEDDKILFTAMLAIGAYESAALMLVPEGWEVSMYFAMASFRPEVQLENEATRIKWEPPITGNASTPALALIAAIVRV